MSQMFFLSYDWTTDGYTAIFYGIFTFPNRKNRSPRLLLLCLRWHLSNTYNYSISKQYICQLSFFYILFYSYFSLNLTHCHTTTTLSITASMTRTTFASMTALHPDTSDIFSIP